MANNRQIALLKKLLRKEVSSFCRQHSFDRVNSIYATIDEIKQRNWNAVFFGGTLRSLLLSRLIQNKPGKPRDIDIVISGANLQELHSSFEPFISRQTRFGGLQLKRVNWQFDVWPIEETYALKKTSTTPTFADLPATTFFNVESIAVEVWPKTGHPRKIFSGNDQFFRAVIDQTLEINHEENPFPQLCVVRALVMLANLRWKVGPRLLNYLKKQGLQMATSDFIEIQEKHYGKIQWKGDLFRTAMKEVLAVQNDIDKPIEISLPGQLTFWPETETQEQRIHLRTLKFNQTLGSLES